MRNETPIQSSRSNNVLGESKENRLSVLLIAYFLSLKLVLFLVSLVTIYDNIVDFIESTSGLMIKPRAYNKADYWNNIPYKEKVKILLIDDSVQWNRFQNQLREKRIVCIVVLLARFFRTKAPYACSVY